MSDGTAIQRALVALGKAQVDAMFARKGDVKFTIDDSEFVPLLECALTAFEAQGLDAAGVEALWDHAYRVYDRLCQEADPSYTFEENRDLMRKHVIGPRRLSGRTRKASRRPHKEGT